MMPCREIIETEQRLRSLEEQANQSATALQKIGATGEKLQTVGNKISSVGQKLLPVTGVVTGLGTAAVKTAADFDSAMSKVAAVSGATGSDFDSLRDKAREMGAKTKFSATEAADAMQDNLEGQLTILKSQLQELAISFGDLLMPAVRSIVSGLQGMLDVLNVRILMRWSWKMWRRIPAVRRRQGRRRGMWCGMGLHGSRCRFP